MIASIRQDPRDHDRLEIELYNQRGELPVKRIDWTVGYTDASDQALLTLYLLNKSVTDVWLSDQIYGKLVGPFGFTFDVHAGTL